jgi:hypothetical protein
MLGVPLLAKVSSSIDKDVVCNVLCNGKDAIGDVLLCKDGAIM